MRQALVVLAFLAVPLAASADTAPVDLSVVLGTTGTSVRVGDTVTYTAAVQNRGPSSALRAGASFELYGPAVAAERATASRGFCFHVPGTDGDVNCELRSKPLQPHGILTFTLTLRTKERGRLQVYVSDFTNTKDGDRRNDTATAFTTVR